MSFTTTHSSLVGYALTLIVVSAFAVYPAVAPLGLAGGASPFGFVLSAMVLSLVGTSAVALARNEFVVPAHKQMAGRFILGTLFFLEHISLLFALGYLQVPVAMSLIYTYPFIIGAVGVWGQGHPASLTLWGSLALCLAGVFCVLGFSAEQLSPLGVMLALIQAALAASRILLTAKLVKEAPGLVLTTQMLMVGVILGFLTLPIVPLRLPSTALGWAAVVLAGLSGMFGHACLAWALKRIHSVPFGVIMNLEPVIAAALSAVILGQILRPAQYLGALIVVVAVIWYGYAERKRLKA